jgi:hypothetical protein
MKKDEKFSLDAEIVSFVSKNKAFRSVKTSREVISRLRRTFNTLAVNDINTKEALGYDGFSRIFGSTMSDGNMRKSHRYFVQFIHFIGEKYSPKPPISKHRENTNAMISINRIDVFLLREAIDTAKQQLDAIYNFVSAVYSHKK